MAEEYQHEDGHGRLLPQESSMCCSCISSEPTIIEDRVCSSARIPLLKPGLGFKEEYDDEEDVKYWWAALVKNSIMLMFMSVVYFVTVVPGDSSNEKLQRLKHKPSRFPTREEENRGMRFLSARRGGFMCGEDPTAWQSSPTCEKLDEWIKDSVIEIVRHIREAPFLHYVFDKSSSSRVLQRHRVSEHMFERSDCWRMIRKSLRDISPDGVILVQRLDQGSACKICFAQGSAGDDHLCSHGKEGQNLDEEGRTDLWGLVIQGRSPGSSACYILKTTQTVSGSGICIHFCLTRARCFGPSPQVQLANSWLLQSEK